jgi:hypothetical protein
VPPNPSCTDPRAASLTAGSGVGIEPSLTGDTGRWRTIALVESLEPKDQDAIVGQYSLMSPGRPPRKTAELGKFPRWGAVGGVRELPIR